MASDTAAYLPALDWQWPGQCEEASRHCNVSCSCSSLPVLVSFTLPGCVRFVDISYRKKGDKDFLTAVKPFYERASEQVGCCGLWAWGTALLHYAPSPLQQVKEQKEEFEDTEQLYRETLDYFKADPNLKPEEFFNKIGEFIKFFKDELEAYRKQEADRIAKERKEEAKREAREKKAKGGGDGGKKKKKKKAKAAGGEESKGEEKEVTGLLGTVKLRSTK